MKSHLAGSPWDGDAKKRPFWPGPIQPPMDAGFRRLARWPWSFLVRPSTTAEQKRKQCELQKTAAGPWPNQHVDLFASAWRLSDQTRKHGLWVDCVEILSLWWSSQAERAEASKTRTFQSHMFLDIGANLGLCSFTILASDPVASVTMFEPVVHNQKQIAESLCRNPGWARRAALFLGALSSERA